MINIDTINQYNRLSFGSSQFDNAGFFNLPRILEQQEKPNIVFFEWSTTTEGNFNVAKLNYFIGILLHNNILPVFLILPKIDTFKENRKSDFLLYKLSDNYELPLLDLRYLLNKYSPEEIIRDNVHTTQFGAGIYAREIYNFLHSDDWKNISIDHRKNIAYPDSYQINITDINNEFTKTQYLELNFDAISDKSEITASFLKGPSSPIIEIFSDGLHVGDASVFDPWCHYERENFMPLISNKLIHKGRNKIEIKISDKNPDYSTTKTREVYLDQKKLKIKSIFTNDIINFSFFIKNI